ncbi:MAG: metallophosphoesterase family protein [Acidobacteriota bacterium]
MLELGLISDTHGLLRPEALAALAGCDRILHAGDVGGPDILELLRRIAPVTAVRGNVDMDPPLSRLPPSATIEWNGLRIHMLHIREELKLDPLARGFAAVVFGHTHRPLAEVKQGVLYLNPGSAGPRRFDLPVTVARLSVERSGERPVPVVRHIELAV